MQRVRVVAPAKINLYLGVGAQRADGFHDVETVLQTFALHDILTITEVKSTSILAEPCDAAQPMREVTVSVEPGQGVRASARVLWSAGLQPVEIADEENIAVRAITELAQELGKTEDISIRIILEKHIPAQAGLGGGSSDAAAALVGAAKLWDVDANDERVVRVAQKLGSDVAFFLTGGAARMSGRGDVLGSSLTPRTGSVVLVKPATGVSTGAAYRAFDAEPIEITADERTQMQTATDALEVPLVNNMMHAACMVNAELAALDTRLADLEASHEGMWHLLCGSGSCMCVGADSYTQAQSIQAELSRAGYWARTTSFSSLRAAILPER